MAETKQGRLSPGDRIRFKPAGNSGKRWWLIRAHNERYTVATQQAPFMEKGDLQYTVVDHLRSHTRNGVGPGVARSSLNSLGGGMDCTTDEDCERILASLESGRWELSERRVLQVDEIERKG